MADNLDVKKWIRRSQMDFDTASREAAIFRPPLEQVCFLCQQSVEKILKAYSISRTGTRTRSHILIDLLDECVPYSEEFNNFKVCCERLEPYVRLARYPADIEPTEYHMKQALNDASAVLEFTKSKLKELGYEYLPEQDAPQ